jgi:hypothetical protein
MYMYRQRVRPARAAAVCAQLVLIYFFLTCCGLRREAAALLAFRPVLSNARNTDGVFASARAVARSTTLPRKKKLKKASVKNIASRESFFFLKL